MNSKLPESHCTGGCNVKGIYSVGHGDSNGVVATGNGIRRKSVPFRSKNHRKFVGGLKTGVINADRIIGLLQANEMKRIDLVVNRLRMDMVKRGDMMSIDDVVDILSIHLIGAIYDDENIVISTNHGEPLVCTDTPAGKAYMNICKRILGEDIPLYSPEKEKSIWFRLNGIFQKV